MSDLRIRSEAIPDADWAQPFLPPAAMTDDDGYDDGVDFSPLLAAIGRALGRLFGLTVSVGPGRPPQRADGRPGPRVDPQLVSLLATLRLGGDPARPAATGGSGLARYDAAIIAAIDAVSQTDWPPASTASRFDLEVRCSHARGVVEGHALVLAPPRVAPPPRRPIAALRHEIMTLPMRLRVELAAEMRMVGSLLPLRTGQVLAISPSAEMPLIVGRHRIGQVKVTAQPDGRQHAEIVAIGVEALGGRG
jgi:flagellar motor switch/type III secretory pathway protein FliN